MTGSPIKVAYTGEPGAFAEVAGPAHRSGPDVEGVQVDVGELEQRRAEHVALTVGLFDDQTVCLERLHDAVHGRGRQVENRAQVTDAQVPRALEGAQDARRPIDRLDHGASMTRPEQFSRIP